MTAAEKKLRFILSVKSDFYMTDSLSIAVHAFVPSQFEDKFIYMKTKSPVHIMALCMVTDFLPPFIIPMAPDNMEANSLDRDGSSWKTLSLLKGFCALTNKQKKQVLAVRKFRLQRNS